jgi:hypothetical protein
MEKVLRCFALSIFAFIVAIYVVPQPSAQETSATGKNATVTGCLQKGDEAGEYSITGEDGKTYGLRSKAVKLSEHLGHKVTVSGTLTTEGAYEKEEKKNEEHEKKEAAEAGDIRVTSLKMVSEKCQ